MATATAPITHTTALNVQSAIVRTRLTDLGYWFPLSKKADALGPEAAREAGMFLALTLTAKSRKTGNEMVLRFRFSQQLQLGYRKSPGFWVEAMDHGRFVYLGHLTLDKRGGWLFRVGTTHKVKDETVLRGCAWVAQALVEAREDLDSKVEFHIGRV